MYLISWTSTSINTEMARIKRTRDWRPFLIDKCMGNIYNGQVRINAIEERYQDYDVFSTIYQRFLYVSGG